MLPIGQNAGDTGLRSRRRPSRALIRAQAAALIRHAPPVIVARSGVMLMALVDAVMVGRLGAGELAALGLALATVTTPLLIGIGLAVGGLVTTATAWGGGDAAACGAIWRRAMATLGVWGIASAAACLFATDALLIAGQDPALADRAGDVAAVLGLGVAPQLMFIATQFLLEGVKRPRPGMALMIVANLLNFALNWVLVYGAFGAPALGALGSAWATTLVRVFLCAGALAVVLATPDRRRLFPEGVWPRSRPFALAPEIASQQRRIGWASAVSIGVEGAAFNLVSLFAGRLGPGPLAAYTIGVNVISLVFMVAIGVGAAAAVQVGHARGRGDLAAAALAAWVALALGLLAMTAIGALLWTFPQTIAGFYADDAGLRAAAAPIIALAAFAVVADGGQGVMAATLRGFGDAWAAAALQAAGLLGVMVPLAWLWADSDGAPGLMRSVIVGCAVTLALLCARVRALTRPGATPSRLPVQDRLQ